MADDLSNSKQRTLFQFGFGSSNSVDSTSVVVSNEDQENGFGETRNCVSHAMDPTSVVVSNEDQENGFGETRNCVSHAMDPTSVVVSNEDQENDFEDQENGFGETRNCVSHARYPTTVSWNRQDWPVIVPSFHEREEAVLERLDSMVSFDPSLPTHQQLKRFVYEFVRYHHANRHAWVFTIKLAGEKDAIVYVIVYKDGSFKIGYSMNGGYRIRWQLTNRSTGELSKSCYGYTILSDQQATSIIGPTAVAFIQSLELPQMAVHPDWVSDWQSRSISLFLGELFLACSLKECVTGNVIERFVSLPSQRVRKTVNEIEYLDPDLVAKAVEFLKNTPDGSVHCLLAWITFLCQLRDKGVDSELAL